MFIRYLLRAIKYFSLFSVGVLIIAATLLYLITFHPKPIENANLVCPDTAPSLNASQAIKVLNYNVQYFAGKDYVFYYDVENEAGPDTRPSPQAIKATLDSISALILAEDADILLLQELHQDAAATDHQNQTDELLSRLKGKYPCYSEAFYWQADFVPHPSIMGSVGMKLVTFSKYKIESAQRHQLSLMDSDPVTKQFNLKRAVLVSQIPIDNGDSFTAMNTHLDAFSQGMNTMDLQVAEVVEIMAKSASPKIIGGDFNLLAPGQYSYLPADQQIWYNPVSEISPITFEYASIPSLEDIKGESRADWFTHYPNDPQVSGPDRTIDYIFYDERLQVLTSKVMKGGALRLSDHLPVIATFQLP